jgi:hypothetical protein
MSVVLAPVRAVALAGELIRAALPKLGKVASDKSIYLPWRVLGGGSYRLPHPFIKVAGGDALRIFRFDP